MKVKAKVVHGSRRGHEIGFPTVNLRVIGGDLPDYGVYRAFLFYGHEKYPAVLHYGPRETFNEHEASLEVHILDFNEEIYGAELEVEFLEKIREVRKFDSIDDLRDRIMEDVEYARKKFTI